MSDQDRWTLKITFPLVSDQGWEEQSEGEDWASQVLREVKDVWEFDDEISNDYKGMDFAEETLWELSEDRSKLIFYSDVIDAIEVPIHAVVMRTIPLSMVLTKEDE